MRWIPFVASLAWMVGCGGATANETNVEDAASEDVSENDGSTDNGAEPEDSASIDASPPVDAGSRCTVTETTVSCTHNITSLKASPTVVRDVYWQSPLRAKPASGYPAVIVYQGSFGGPALTWGTLTKSTPFGGFYQGLLQARLLDEGFIVIAPSAAGGSVWQSNSGVTWENTTDSVFIAALLAAIEKGTFGPVDTKRLYATGISSGGYMTSRMAVSYPGRFRALAIQSASYATCLGPVCTIPAKLPADHPPTLFLHGEKDTTVPISTMLPYPAKLGAQGIVTDKAIDPSAAHEWLSVAPERITNWFVTH